MDAAVFLRKLADLIDMAQELPETKKEPVEVPTVIVKSELPTKSKIEIGGNEDNFDEHTAVKTYKAVEKATQAGLIASLHDCSEGGAAVALAEMAFAGGLGATVLLKKLPYKGEQRREDVCLFFGKQFAFSSRGLTCQ